MKTVFTSALLLFSVGSFATNEGNVSMQTQMNTDIILEEETESFETEVEGLIARYRSLEEFDIDAIQAEFEVEEEENDQF